VPGLSGELNAFQADRPLELGKGIEKFIEAALLDFTHLTVLMYLVRKAEGPCTPGEIAEDIGDPKKTIADVLERFEKLAIVRSSPGLLTRKYLLDRQAAGMELVIRLIKLWEHPQTHGAILHRVLAPKGLRA
jgi:DNA-binding MarR family transcriptional regulator